MPRHKITNTFMKGMNKDKTWTKSDPDSYRESSNLRPITDDMGDSTGSLSTVKGNAFNYAIPKLFDSYTLKAFDFFIDALDGSGGTITFNVNGVVIPFNYDSPSADEFYKSLAEHINTNSTLFGSGVTAQANEEFVAVYSNTYQNITAVGGANLMTRVLGTGFDEAVIIGETTIRDTSILFTTNYPGTSSAIWKVVWNEQDEPELTLVRHANDNFSTYHDIEAVGRYELNSIQRVYWTDFNNDLRSLNVESPSSFLDNIDITQNIKYTIPYVQKINQEGGELKVGWYSYAYRQKILSGTQTAFSAWSACFPLQENNEDEKRLKYIEYVGSMEDEVTTKSLTVEITNMDASYSHIDVIGMYQKDISSKGIYFYVEKEVELTGSGDYVFTHSKINEVDFISEEEIYIPNTIFTKCKTLAIKDNRLLVGNIKDTATVLNNFDARAIRYPKYAYSTSSGYELTVDQTNPYNKDSTKVSHEEKNQHKYKKGTDIQGGTGANISYEFVQKEFMLDRYREISKPGGGGAGRHKVSSDPDAYIDTATVNNRTVQMGNYWNCFKNPFFASHFRGYLRSEVYRFGIVFFDKAGRTLEVEWVDDIRMPDQSEKFHAYNKPWEGYTRGYSLGVKFSVTVPDDIREAVSGFSIVRAERASKDENIRAQGMITDLSNIRLCHRETADPPGPDKKSEGGYYLCRNTRQGWFGQVGDYDDNNFIAAPYTCLHLPRFLLKSHAFDFNGYKIRPIGVVEVTGRNVLNSGNAEVPVDSWGPGGTDKWRWSKYFNVRSYYADYNSSDSYKTLSNKIEDYQFCPGQDSPNPRLVEPTAILDGTPSWDRWRSILNYSWPHDQRNFYGYNTDRLVNNAISGSNQVKMRGRGGSPCHIVRINGTTHKKLYFSSPGVGSEYPVTNSRVGPSSLWGGGTSTDKHKLGILNGGSGGAQWWRGEATRKVMFNLYRETEQYGGATKNDILATEYISTGHYQYVSINDASNVYECEVFGGDTYVSVWAENTIATHNSSSGFSKYSEMFSPNANEDEAFGDGTIFAIESKINLEWRRGRSINNIDVANTDGDGDNFISTRDNLDSLKNPTNTDANWQQRQHNHKKYLSLGSFRNETDEWDNRIWASENKINGEPLDSWATFKVNNLIDVDGNLGPINKLESFNNEVFYFQDRAFGNVVVNPTPMLSGADGITMSLGTGKVLHDFNYVSTSVGTKHQWSVFSTPNSIYWFDILNKKPYRFSGRGAEELSDMKGMHSFFLSNVDNKLINTDNPARKRGIRGTYDFLNNEALFTFLQSKTFYNDTVADYNTYGSALGGSGALVPEGSLVGYQDNITIRDDDGVFIALVGYQRVFDVIQSYPIGSATGTPGFFQSLLPNAYKTTEYLKERPSYLGLYFTIGFSEPMDAWSTFYNFAPTIYINTKSRLLSPNIYFPSRVHLHNVGKYNKFYGNIYDSILEIVSNQAPDQTKVYDNVSWHTNARTDDGAGGQTLDQTTFDEYYCYNDYQHSGIISLSSNGAPVDDIRKVEREWQTFIPRNVVKETGANIDVLNPNNWNLSREYSDRIRDKYLVQRFRYDASKSDQFIINYINTYVRTSNR